VYIAGDQAVITVEAVAEKMDKRKLTKAERRTL
jgi:hypothetical protein